MSNIYKQPCVRIEFPDGEPAFRLEGYDLQRIPDIAIGSCVLRPHEVVVCTANSQQTWKWEYDRDYEISLVRLAGVWWLCQVGLVEEYEVTADELEHLDALVYPRLPDKQDEAGNAL